MAGVNTQRALLDGFQFKIGEVMYQETLCAAAGAAGRMQATAVQYASRAVLALVKREVSLPRNSTLGRL
jgi:hypothetical protein